MRAQEALALLAQAAPGGELSWIQTGGIVALLLAIAWAGFRRKWYFAVHVEDLRAMYEARLSTAAERLEECQAERDRWQEAALRGTGLAQWAAGLRAEERPPEPERR